MANQNTGDFFVMLTTQSGSYTPLVLCSDIENNIEELAKFETKDAAIKGAEKTVLGENFGYEVFEIGCGC